MNYKDKFVLIEKNLDLLMSLLFDLEMTNKPVTRVYFASFEDYLRAEKGKKVETNYERFKNQFKLTDNELNLIKKQILELLKLNKKLISKYDSEHYVEFTLLLKQFYNFMLPFLIKNKARDYINGMHNCLLRVIHHITLIENEEKSNNV